MSGMDVALNEVHVNGNEADVTASISPKGGPATNGMSIQYHLQQRNNKWVVTGRKEAGGGSPHGAIAPAGGAMAPGANPHGGAMAPAGGTMAPGANPHGGAMPGGAAGQMPSPSDLPPTKKK